jgi:outer membrane receptor for ferrienterochelin and colicin
MKKFLFLLLLASQAAFGSETWNYEVTASKLDESRNKLSPKTGGSSFSFNKEAIENLPQGQMTSLDQVLARAPGVAQNAHGQLYVRGDHANLQYRINGVMLPEGVTGFGQVLDTHFADRVDFMTGAMPAQYGLRTAGVIDLQTKGGKFEKGGYSELMVGQNNDFGANQQISGAKGNLNYYLSATYLQNNRGIESPTAARKSIHNDTNQNRLFGYFSYLLDPSKRLSFIVGNADSRYQIPNNPGQETAYQLNGYDSFDSRNLSQRQSESNRYAITSLQGVTDSDVDYQVSAFTRYSGLDYRSDHVGDLMINGVASNLDRSSFATGLQGDFSKKLNEKNTLRSGFYFNNERNRSYTENYVFDLDEVTEEQASNDPRKINELASKTSRIYSLYLQNEWKALDDLTINYGGRFDAAQAYTNESQLSPRLNSTYNLSKKTKIHAGFSRYFTPAPVAKMSQTSLANFSGTTNEAEGNLDSYGKLRAERTSYYDVGISHQVNENLTIGLDGYYKKIRNMLDEHQFGNALIYVPFNYQQGKVFGTEFKADYRNKNFSSFLNLGLQKAYARNIVSNQYIHEAEEIDYISKHNVRPDHLQNLTASAGAAYKWLGTKFSGDVLYGSGLSTGENNKNTMPSWMTFNASISRDFDLPNLGRVNFRVAGTNLADKVYRFSNGSGIGVNASQYGMRRTFYLIASKSF